MVIRRKRGVMALTTDAAMNERLVRDSWHPVKRAGLAKENVHMLCFQRLRRMILRWAEI